MIKSKPKNTNAKKIITPYCSRNLRTPYMELGRNANKTPEPSSGGIGTRLNIASAEFVITMILNSPISAVDQFVIGPAERMRMNIPNTNASVILLSGPAADTIAVSLSGFRKLRGLIGTGFAQPNTTPPGIIAIKRGSIIEPNRSMCLIGFSVSLPARRAVGSPNRSATNPCEISCITTEKTRTINLNTNKIESMCVFTISQNAKY